MSAGEEQRCLVPGTEPAHSHASRQATASRTCLVRFAGNKYPATQHPRVRAGPGGPESPTPSRCWRASPGRSAGGAPFRARHLPAPPAAVRERLETGRDGGEQMVCILPGARDHGLEAICAACAEALAAGNCNADLVPDIAARRCEPGGAGARRSAGGRSRTP